MFKRAAAFILGMLSLVIAETLQYTEVFFIDFTAAPANVQILASWTFLLMFIVSILYAGMGAFEV